MPLSIDQGLGILVWSPLAGGLLSGKYRRGVEAPAGSRHLSEWDEPPVNDEDKLYDTIEAAVAIGEAHGVSAAQVALAWLLAKPAVTSLIVGARTTGAAARQPRRRRAGARAPDEIARLDEVSGEPLRYPYWHQAKTSSDRLSPRRPHADGAPPVLSRAAPAGGRAAGRQAAAGLGHGQDVAVRVLEVRDPVSPGNDAMPRASVLMPSPSYCSKTTRGRELVDHLLDVADLPAGDRGRRRPGVGRREDVDDGPRAADVGDVVLRLMVGRRLQAEHGLVELRATAPCPRRRSPRPRDSRPTPSTPLPPAS